MSFNNDGIFASEFLHFSIVERCFISIFKSYCSIFFLQNLAQYLSEEQKRIMDLWAELQQVRRQFADYKDQTARELKAQREEFARMSQNVGGVVRKLSITSIGVRL